MKLFGQIGSHKVSAWTNQKDGLRVKVTPGKKRGKSRKRKPKLEDRLFPHLAKTPFKFW